MKKQMNRLTQADFYKVCQLMTANKDEFLSEKPTLTKTAERLSKEANLTVNEKQIRQIQEVTGVLWQAVTVRQPGKMKKYIAELQAEVASLRGLVHHLYRNLGASPPVGYALPNADSKNVSVVSGKCM